MDLNELENRLRGHAQNTIEKIESPFNLKNVVNKKEINKLEGRSMNKYKNVDWIKRAATIAAVVSICLITVVAANPEKGFFKDVTRFDGAIRGTEYVNAQNEVTFKVIQDEEGNETFELEVEFVKKDVAPFKYIQEIVIPEYKIVNEKDEEILSVKNSLENATKATVEDGKVLLKLTIPEEITSQIESQKHFIEIENIYGLAKTEQPLKISGGWKVEL